MRAVAAAGLAKQRNSAMAEDSSDEGSEEFKPDGATTPTSDSESADPMDEEKPNPKVAIRRRSS
jgi:hypothetical protein